MVSMVEEGEDVVRIIFFSGVGKKLLNQTIKNGDGQIFQDEDRIPDRHNQKDTSLRIQITYQLTFLQLSPIITRYGIVLTLKIKRDIDHNCYFDRAKNDSTDFEYAIVSFSGRGAGPPAARDGGDGARNDAIYY